MYAERMIASDEVCCTCYALEEVLFREGVDSGCGDIHLEVFTEFIGLFDGSYWSVHAYQSLKESNYFWWEPRWKEPRIRALDCVLWE